MKLIHYLLFISNIPDKFLIIVDKEQPRNQGQHPEDF